MKKKSEKRISKCETNSKFVILKTGFPGVVVLFLVAAANPAPTILQQQGPVSLAVGGMVEKGVVQMRLSDVLPLIVRVEGPADVEVKIPFPLVSPGWKVEPEKPVRENNPPAWRQVFNLTPLGPGKQTLQVAPLKVGSKAGAEQTIRWKPIPVQVNTEIRAPDIKEMRDISPIEDIPAEPSLWSRWGWLLAGMAGLALLAGAWVWLRRQRKRGPDLTPSQWARRELDRIQALELPSKGHLERFHTMLSNVIRRYLENRFQLPARRQTTPEFFQAMERSSRLLAEQRALLRQFLERCDLAKFAGLEPSADACRELLASARQFVEQADNTDKDVRATSFKD